MFSKPILILYTFCFWLSKQKSMLFLENSSGKGSLKQRGRNKTTKQFYFTLNFSISTKITCKCLIRYNFFLFNFIQGLFFGSRIAFCTRPNSEILIVYQCLETNILIKYDCFYRPHFLCRFCQRLIYLLACAQKLVIMLQTSMK